MRDESARTNHPEAGLLAAFAENALSRQERHAILLHLGECARCREIVFLAQQAAASEAPASSASPQRVRVRRWLPVVASGLAALLIAGVSMVWVNHQQRNSAANGTIAMRSQPPTPAAIPATEPAEAKAPQPGGVTQRVPQPPPPTSLAPRTAPAQPLAAQSAANQPQALPAIPSSLKGAHESEMQMEARIEKQYELRAHAMETQRARLQAATKSETTLAPHPGTGMPDTPTMATSATSASQSNPTFASNANPASAPSYGRPVYSMEETPMPSTSAALSTAAKPRISLPSGLRAASSLTVEGRTLALDTGGNLFASDDNGRRWRRITTPWTGKALLLIGLPPGEASTTSGSNREGASPPAGYGSVEVYCSTQEKWVSFDLGQTWQPASLEPATPAKK